MKLLYLLGRGLGALAGASASLLWMLALWLPMSGPTLTGLNFVVTLLMVLMALFVVIASVRGHSLVLFVAFVASFFPVGFYLLGVSHWLSWVGWLNLCYLAAGAMIAFGRRAEPSTAVQ